MNRSAIATYKGSIKKFYQAIAWKLDIPTAETHYNKNSYSRVRRKNLMVMGNKGLYITDR
jgi:hypothetical protein